MRKGLSFGLLGLAVQWIAGCTGTIDMGMGNAAFDFASEPVQTLSAPSELAPKDTVVVSAGASFYIDKQNCPVSSECLVVSIQFGPQVEGQGRDASLELFIDLAGARQQGVNVQVACQALYHEVGPEQARYEGKSVDCRASLSRLDSQKQLYVGEFQMLITGIDSSHPGSRALLKGRFSDEIAE